MRILAFDPGGERMGFGCLEQESEEIKYLGSGLLGLHQGNKKYQHYRLDLIDMWVKEADTLLRSYEPDVVVSEIVPPVGGSAPNQVQRQLALTAITTVQAIARTRSVKIEQMSATTVKADIGGSNKATKVSVRNGVIKLIPRLADRKRQWTSVFDESDALAVALSYLGYKNGR